MEGSKGNNAGMMAVGSRKEETHKSVRWSGRGQVMQVMVMTVDLA